MNERLAFIRAKYEQRSFFGPPSAATLRAAAADCELRLEQLPAGYLDGVDHLASGGGAAAAPAASGAAGGSAEADGGKVNPAVARRLAKKREEEEAARAVSDAAAAATAAVSQAQLGDSEWRARLVRARMHGLAALSYRCAFPLSPVGLLLGWAQPRVKTMASRTSRETPFPTRRRSAPLPALPQSRSLQCSPLRHPHQAAPVAGSLSCRLQRHRPPHPSPSWPPHPLRRRC